MNPFNLFESKIERLAMSIVNHINEINNVSVEIRQKNNDLCFDYVIEKIKGFIKGENI